MDHELRRVLGRIAYLEAERRLEVRQHTARIEKLDGELRKAIAERERLTLA